MNRILLSITCLAIGLNYQAQQSTSFAFNEVIKSSYNPAYATFKNEWSLNLGHRLLLSSMPGSPMNNVLSFNTNINKSHGLGLVVSQGSRSVFKEFEGYLNYGYAVRFGSQWKLGFGLGAGVKSQSLDLNNQVYFQEDDPMFNTQSYAGMTYDVRFGGYLSSDRLLFHFAGLQLAGQRFNDNISDLQQNIVAGLEYLFNLPKDLTLTPVISANYYPNGPLQYNLGGTITYNKIVSVGAHFRSGYAVTPTVAIQFKNVKFGYGFDLIQLSDINYGLGHEVFLSFSKQKYGSKVEMISKEEATERIYELIDSYFDVQASDLSLVEKKKLMSELRNEIYELLPYIDDESRQQIEKSLNKKPKNKKKKGSSNGK
jgi:type IX secretion system PorP/SprF family membrane protein